MAGKQSHALGDPLGGGGPGAARATHAHPKVRSATLRRQRLCKTRRREAVLRALPEITIGALLIHHPLAIAARLSLPCRACHRSPHSRVSILPGSKLCFCHRSTPVRSFAASRLNWIGAGRTASLRRRKRLTGFGSHFNPIIPCRAMPMFRTSIDYSTRMPSPLKW